MCLRCSSIFSNVFWMGDLNYRLIGNDFIDDVAIREIASSGNVEDLKPLDQVSFFFWGGGGDQVSVFFWGGDQVSVFLGGSG